MIAEMDQVLKNIQDKLLELARRLDAYDSPDQFWPSVGDDLKRARDIVQNVRSVLYEEITKND